MHAEQAHACRGEFNREWHAVQPPTNLGNRRCIVRSDCKVLLDSARPFDEQADGAGTFDFFDILVRRGRQRLQLEHCLARNVQQPLTSGQQMQLGRMYRQLNCQAADRVRHVLSVVEDQQHVLRGQHVEQSLLRNTRFPDSNAQSLYHGLCHQRRIASRGKFDQPHAVPEPRLQLPCDRQRQRRFPHTAGARDRDQPMRFDQRRESADCVVPTDRRRQIGREVPAGCLLRSDRSHQR